MAKNIENIMICEPADALTFEGPFNRAIKRCLVIRSLVNKDMAYKLKTTSPRLFYVRPNIGIIGAKSSVSIEIFMPPTLPLSPDPFGKRHKFLIVVGEAPEPVVDLQNFFKDLDPANAWEGRVRCELVLPMPENNNGFGDIILDESIRQTVGGEPNEELERTYDALEVSTLVDMQILQEKVSNLEKVRLELSQQIQDLRDSAEKGQHAKKVLLRQRSTMFLFSAACVAVGAILFFGNFGKDFLKLIEKAF
ncbi:vesicle-associated membrane protein-associated protein B-like [Drosophila pseudoobscura]|uniref:Vesicle-associated membrane protein-associated protein B-like n=1 Tax=Drosophila pseudoobscura pseudoobscura TaxID=46245 RepID=A0A6I8UY11_DROPS|nr:vesicle-associated membrane protein-associated protein B [Drosophila pseudoobscura]